MSKCLTNRLLLFYYAATVNYSSVLLSTGVLFSSPPMEAVLVCQSGWSVCQQFFENQQPDLPYAYLQFPISGLEELVRRGLFRMPFSRKDGDVLQAICR